MYFLAAACCLFVLQSCTKEDVTITEDNSAVEDALRKGNAPAASGQGTIDFLAEGKRHLSFNVKTKKDGTVSGSGQLTYTQGELKVKFSIDCISVTGNVANMTGKIISNSNTPEQAGSGFYFSVIDNGEGNNSDPDMMSAMSIGNFICSQTTNTYYEVLEGNIQVSE